ncbi:hypothetical protein B0H19DRAFT_1074053 [Mycena capillaripes]|nr:hypothetical protein B0H19DRAFT_1074053 [Mycena capillaripes]
MPSKLFEPIKVGNAALQHRIVLAPLTRFKADKEHIPFLPLVVEYYAQRASKPGTLLVTEATFIAACAIVAGVHAKGSFIFSQLWALGRAADYADLHAEDPSLPYVSASAIPLADHSGPLRALTVLEIKEYIGLYIQAAKNALEAGFDGVEIHCANSYLMDQFLQDVSNKRTDEYGRSVENRARFALEVIDAVVATVGAEKTSVRFSPWNPFQEMGMADPIPQFSYLISQLAARYPDLAYLHLVEPRINGNTTRHDDEVGKHESNDTLRALWAPRPLVRAGGFTRAGAIKAAESGDLIAFGRLYISNPDLPTRLEKDVPLAAFDRDMFYLVGENGPRGYTDQAFATVEVAA